MTEWIFLSFKCSTNISNINFSGILIPNNKEVAMKFTANLYESYAKDEYEMYNYMHAIDDPASELRGIPAVYYYGHWKDFTIMATTLLESSCATKLSDKKFTNNDILLMARNFVSRIDYFCF